VNTPPTPPDATALIAAAVHALQKGDRRAARQYAEQAAALAPQSEQPWLLLAYLASPKAAAFYLERALQINPASTQALAAQAWLQQRAASDILAPTRPQAQPPIPQPAERPPQAATVPAAVTSLPPVPAFTIRPADELTASLPTLPVDVSTPTSSIGRTAADAPRRGRSRGWLVALALLLVLSLAGLTAMTFAANQNNHWDNRLGKTAETILKASLTASPLPSATPTASPQPSSTVPPQATATVSPPPTHSPQPSASPSPTARPSATRQPTATPVKISQYTIQVGDTLSSIAQRFNISIADLIAANNLSNPSLIHAGQVLTIPGAGQVVSTARPTGIVQVSAPTGQGKEILVDISEQHLYAYQDNKLVFSLVASTGIGNSTRIGTFKVLDKIPRAYSNSFNIWMPYWMGIYYSGTLENGIHGLPLLMNGVELWGNLLGRPATYGCIEMKTSEAKALYDWAEIGTRVIIRP
jgi:LysM repeat protein